MEIWKDIPSYEGVYQVSDLGRVRSLDRVSLAGRRLKGKILKHGISRGHHAVTLFGGAPYQQRVHRLVAEAFLGYDIKRSELVVHHIDNDRDNNKLSNLSVISQRENCFTHFKGTSKYKGVHWDTAESKWKASILIDKKRYYLGRYTEEKDARDAYLNKLKQII